MHFDGSEWQLWRTPVANGVTGLWASGPSDVWAVGTGFIIHFDGTGWSVAATPGVALTALWGSGPNDLWAGGPNGLLHFTGTTWSPVSTGFTADVRSIHGSSANDVWVGTADGNTLHFNGSQWSSASVNGSTFYPVADVWAVSAGEVYALTSSATGVVLARWSGTQWQPTGFTQSGAGYRLWAPPGGPLYLGTSTGVHTWSGTAQARVTTRSVYALGGTASDLWVQNADATTSRVTDGGVTDVVTPGQHLWAVATFGPNDVWVAGARGLAMHKTDDRFHQVPLPTTADILSVWGTSPTNLWASGTGGTLLHFDGTQWANVSTPTTVSTMRLSRIWGLSASEVYVMAELGYYLRFNGAAWLLELAPGSAPLNDVWGPTPTGLWAASMSTVLRPANWVSTVSLSHPAVTLWGNGSNDIWCAGGSGLSHFNGTTWANVPLTPSGTGHRRLWGAAPDDVWLLGTSPTFRHFDGVTWRRDAWSSANAMYALHGSASADVWAAGEAGLILRLE